MLPTSRDEIFNLLKALGVEIHPQTTLSTDALEKRLRKALDCAQYITDAVNISEDGDGQIDLSGVKPWSKGKVFDAVRRGSLTEAMINSATPNAIPDLYVNALMDLRQTAMSLAANFDKGHTLFWLQDANREESSIIIRIIKVFEKHKTVPVFMVFYVHGTKENPKGLDWMEYQSRHNTTASMAHVTCTLAEQSLLLRILEMNSKRIPASYRPKRGPCEQDFTLSFILPVGPLDSMDLGRLNINNGCAVCGKPGGKRCSSCAAIYYCSKECQKSDWPDHKLTCKTLKNAAWTSIRCCIIRPDLPSGTSVASFNNKDFITGRPNSRPTILNAASEPPPNNHGTKPFIVKVQVQYNGDDTDPMMVYDCKRTFTFMYPKSGEDRDEAAKYDAVARLVRSNTAWNGVKMFFWARRTGDWELSLALDKVPDQDVKW
ncbi:hypothetical protein FRB94_012009 [Tulasnella sp. JGI-2019a]|nr:hypothetical protein FRB94_012009 [Tulasnella sp. JGI-2019a]KAG9027192.1 hypothetical protein FRB95_008005 [Tulasnella sp. JGI-2019a]